MTGAVLLWAGVLTFGIVPAGAQTGETATRPDDFVSHHPWLTALILFALVKAVVLGVWLHRRTSARHADDEIAALRRRADDAARSGTVSATVLGLAEEFADVLTTVRGALISVGTTDRLMPETRTALDDAVRAADRGSAVARRLSGIAETRPDALYPCDVSEEIASLGPVIERSIPRAIRLTVETRPGLPTIVADRRHLDTAVLMLVRRVADAIGGVGTLVIRTEDRDGAAAISVEGTGDHPVDRIVMDDTDAALAHAVACAAGGHLELATGGSARATLVFAPPLSRPADAPISLHGGHVLLVDGDDGARRSIARMLRRQNYDVAEVASGDAAMARLVQRSNFDAVIAAVALPGILQGADLVRAVAEVDPGLPVLLTTARPVTGPPGALPKPIRPADLDRELRPAIERRRRLTQDSIRRDLTPG